MNDKTNSLDLDIAALTLRTMEIVQLRVADPMALYVFGSRAHGDHRPDSDLDLALLGSHSIPAMVLWDLKFELEEFFGLDVDLVDLRSAGIVLQHQVVLEGRRIWGNGMDLVTSLYDNIAVHDYQNMQIEIVIAVIENQLDSVLNFVRHLLKTQVQAK